MATKAKVRILNGYRVIYKPDYSNSMKSRNWKGYVYEHIYFVEKHLGRPLRKNEVVHHLDENKQNNKLNNLLVLERSQHSKLHLWLKSVVNSEKTGENGKNSENPKVCEVCEIWLQYQQTRFCSKDCNLKYNAKNSTSLKPTKEELQADFQSRASMLSLGRKYGVSDNAVRKWAKSYNMAIPSRAKRTRLEGVETSGEVQPS